LHSATDRPKPNASHRFAKEAAVISLADYSPSTLKFLKTRDMACVYVFAVQGDRPVKIGHALSLIYRFDQVQSQHPRQITIEHVAWTPSAATAALIAEDVSHKLAARAANARWWGATGRGGLRYARPMTSRHSFNSCGSWLPPALWQSCLPRCC
jgi:hypothetical protein